MAKRKAPADDNQPSPPPPPPKKSRHSPPSPSEAESPCTPTSLSAQDVKSIEREARNHYKRVRIIKLHGFSLERHKNGKSGWILREGLTRREIDLTGITEPVLVVDEDDDNLLYVDPNAKSTKASNDVLRVTLRHANTIGVKPPTKSSVGADGSGRGAVDGYVVRDGQVAGVAKDARSWHGIGQWKCDPGPSREILKNTKNFEAASQLHEDLAPLAYRVNAILQVVDHRFHWALRQLRDTSFDRYAHIRLLAAKDPLLFEGREYMYNRQSGTHVDSSDPRRSYVALSAHGPFNGGALNVPEIGVRVRYDARTIILLRGRVLAHRAESWTGGQRVSIAHFTHSSFWATFGMVPPEHDPSVVGERVYAWENKTGHRYKLSKDNRDIKIGGAFDDYKFKRPKKPKKIE